MASSSSSKNTTGGSSSGSSNSKNDIHFFRECNTISKARHDQCLRDKKSFMEEYKRRGKEGTLPKHPDNFNYLESNFDIYGAAAIHINMYDRGGGLPIIGNPCARLAYKYNEQVELAKKRGETYKYSYTEFLKREEEKQKRNWKTKRIKI